MDRKAERGQRVSSSPRDEPGPVEGMLGQGWEGVMDAGPGTGASMTGYRSGPLCYLDLPTGGPL